MNGPEPLPNLAAAIRHTMGAPWEVVTRITTFRESSGVEVRVGRPFNDELMIGVVSFVPACDWHFDETPEWCSYVAGRVQARLLREVARLN